MNIEKVIGFLVWCVPFWLFVAIKVAGTSLASWSWWWFLLPQIPVLGLLVQHFGL